MIFQPFEEVFHEKLSTRDTQLTVSCKSVDGQYL